MHLMNGILDKNMNPNGKSIKLKAATIGTLSCYKLSF